MHGIGLTAVIERLHQFLLVLQQPGRWRLIIIRLLRRRRIRLRCLLRFIGLCFCLLIPLLFLMMVNCTSGSNNSSCSCWAPTTPPTSPSSSSHTHNNFPYSQSINRLRNIFSAIYFNQMWPTLPKPLPLLRGIRSCINNCPSFAQNSFFELDRPQILKQHEAGSRIIFKHLTNQLNVLNSDHTIDKAS